VSLLNTHGMSNCKAEGSEKPHMVKYKAITNEWNYDASCTLTSLPVWDLENFKCLVFVVQSVPNYYVQKCHISSL
jgi:hypothetical protein